MVTDFLRVALRRWYVLIAGVLATVALTSAVPQVAPPDYTARGLVLLLPAEASTGAGGNPLLMLDGLTTPADVVVAYFKSEAAQELVAKAAPTAEFSVEMEQSTRGPLIAVDVDPETRKLLAHGLVGLAEGASRLLVERGENFDPVTTAQAISSLAWAGLRAAQAAPAKN